MDEHEGYIPHGFPPGTHPLDVFGTLWDRFYAWDFHECQTVLDSLQAIQEEDDWEKEFEHPHADETLDGAYQRNTWGKEEQMEFIDYFEVAESSKSVSTTSRNQLSRKTQTFVLSVRINNEAKASQARFKPSPRYTTCTPLSWNIDTRGADAGPLVAPFATFADDPSFNLTAMLELYDSFAWQTEMDDPNRKSVFSLGLGF